LHDKSKQENKTMDSMLVVVFDTEVKAYDGKSALMQLENEGSIALFAYAVIAKNADGTAIVKQGNDSGPFGTLVGTSLGSLIGLLGGPAGLAIGATVGLLAGSTADLNNARIGADFIDDVTRELVPGKFAVLAEVKEDWTTPVDVSMEAIGGKVFRRSLSEVKQAVHDEEIAAMKADLAQMKAELAEAHAGRKAKLQEKIDQLDAKIEARVQNARERRYAAGLQAKAKVEALKVKAAALRSKAAEVHV